MIIRHARELSWGATVVAAILWFTAFVVLFRRDLGSPLVAAATFVIAGAVVWLLGYGLRRLAAPPSQEDERHSAED